MALEDTGGWILPASLIAGVLCAHMYPYSPPGWLVLLTGLPGLALMLNRRTRFPAVFLLSACWTLWHCQQRLEDRLEPHRNGQIAAISGLVSSIPEVYPQYVRFRFQPEVRAGQSHGQDRWPASLLVYWHRDWPDIKAGERWRFELKLKPGWGRVNFQGPDRERWMFAENIGAVATVHSGQKIARLSTFSMPLLQVRDRIGRAVYMLSASGHGRGVVKALAIADRSSMRSSDRDVLAATGTAHLLAISGLHISLAAVMGFWLTRLLLYPWSLLHRSGAGLLPALAGSFLAALLYAALAGFGVSTVRALIMLTVMTIAMGSHLSIHPLRAWLLALAAVLVIDPLAPLAAGTWFSFSAVAVLMLIFMPRKSVLPWWKTMLVAQGGILLVMMPLNLYWFQFVSPSGFLANLIAIPWVSFVIVPLTLMGMLTLTVPVVVIPGALFTAAALASEGLMFVLGHLASWQGPVPLLAQPTMMSAILAVLGGVLLLLPRGMPGRWLGLFMWLPLIFPPQGRTARDSLRIDLLDVGQGLAVLVSTPNHTLLYDSGPGDGREAGLVRTVIAPALGRLGASRPDRIVISHGDLDHAGGLGQLMERYPDTPRFVKLRKLSQGAHNCHYPLMWSWDNVSFRVLHPTPYLPYLGNDSSCVLSVSTLRDGARASILLSGDISSAVEDRLVQSGVAGHRLMVVPHHGSATSSSEAFIQAVHPRYSIAANGRGNRFGFPKPEVVRRYQGNGSIFWSTGSCGAISVTLNPDGSIEASSARRQRRGMWRWPAGDECP